MYFRNVSSSIDSPGVVPPEHATVGAVSQADPATSDNFGDSNLQTGADASLAPMDENSPSNAGSAESAAAHRPALSQEQDPSNSAKLSPSGNVSRSNGTSPKSKSK